MYALAASMPLGRALGLDASSPVEAARSNVAAYETMRAVAFPTAAVDTVLTAFAKLEGQCPVDKEAYDRGMVMRRKVLGEAYVDRAMEGVDDFNRDFQRIVTQYGWGETWGDP